MPVTNSTQWSNRLINEKSPYLLQHAHNPVDWYPWGDEAFNRAKAEDKPIFLSIGYSTCHWCHVMARESFEDPTVAGILNRSFVSVKVDREERPDVDAVYMAVCQALTGQGGWPLTLLLDTEKRPFYAATYLPKSTGYGRIGLTELLLKVSELWETSRNQLLESGEEIMEAMREQDRTEHIQEPLQGPGENLLYEAFGAFAHSYDSRFGGFGKAPKFPAAHNLLFLLRYAEEENPAAREMALHTLEGMYRGGLFDPVGGGFSRYSTDEKWLVPHFEKTLYDNSLLVMAYLEAYARTKEPLYAHIARKTLDYTARELTDPEGGFYCGQDADSDGIEGKYYLFTPREISSILGENRGRMFCEWFGITKKGNFEGKNILNLLENANYREINPTMERCCVELLSYRDRRTFLHKDDKCLTSWNALMIAAYVKAYFILEEDPYLDTAQKAERFLEEKLSRGDRLFVRWREGVSAGYGKLEDYAFTVWAELMLYQAVFDIRYLKKAVRLADTMCDRFSDDTEGGFYLYARDDEQLILRPKETYDGAMPSGNSVAAYVFGKLFKITGEEKWQERSRKQLRYLAGRSGRYPAGHSFAMLAFMDALNPSQELIALSPEPEDLRELRKLAAAKPILTVVVKSPENGQELAELAPYTKEYPVTAGHPQFYLCSGNSCAAPVDALQALKW